MVTWKRSSWMHLSSWRDRIPSSFVRHFICNMNALDYTAATVSGLVAAAYAMLLVYGLNFTRSWHIYFYTKHWNINGLGDKICIRNWTQRLENIQWPKECLWRWSNKHQQILTVVVGSLAQARSLAQSMIAPSFFKLNLKPLLIMLESTIYTVK